jgi:hypothetical protein
MSEPELEEQPAPDDLPSAEAEKPTEHLWPHVPPVRGQAYGFQCPSTDAYMVAMTVETWQDFSNQQRRLVEEKEFLKKNNQELRDFARRARTGVAISDSGIVTSGGRLPSQDPRQR